MLKDIPNDILAAFSKLKFNKVSNIFWRTNGEHDFTWAYIPEPKVGFHRISNIGAIIKENFCTTEAIGEVPFERFVDECKKFQPEFLQEPLDYNVTEHAYVFFDLNYVKCKQTCVEYLKSRGIIPHGRFGEWEYYNMDVCIKRSLDLARALREKYLS